MDVVPLGPPPSLPSPLCLMWCTGISMWLQVSWELWNLQSMLPEGLDACRCKKRREILRRNLSCNTCTTQLTATNATKCLNPSLMGYLQEPDDLIWVPSLRDALSLHPILGHSIDAYQKYQLKGCPLWEAASPCPRLAEDAFLWHAVLDTAFPVDTLSSPMLPWVVALSEVNWQWQNVNKGQTPLPAQLETLLHQFPYPYL